ncbi:endonuclease/exonuclease/phosphatase family protein [uncultured Sneathiella sp.]|jgi:endonuclease/exonuclease/phosphatase (EEP) superfamily protein YafD|uniref:endonuclease/exonuclease/phosphatase family protein n=1 Tax=uncultured Sneathiella sp. TaxID=879315 RepID=UPI0030DA2344|tara:strand:+ start:7420 stop:8502 length:1083 start_codon:yes stop_codon:yes gene_type:complete
MTYFLLGIPAAFCLAASLMPFIPIAHGIFRMFDFCRLQIAAIATFLLILTAVLLPSNLYSLTFIGMSLGTIAIQLYYIIRFTPLWPKQSVNHDSDQQNAATFSLLVCNVKQGNEDHSRLARLIERRDPDIIILMETDQTWLNSLATVLDPYEHKVSCPQDNSYGMHLVSRLKMLSGDIKLLLNEEIPSFHCRFEIGDGHNFDMISIHPEPPIPHHDTIGRDAEILLAGELATKRERPMIVTGDLNDVAWSETTRRFLRISRLLDPRQGRGMYNTFDARIPFLRWPLDHIFHSQEFELVSISREPSVGSDHFPMFYEFSLVYENGNSLPDKPTEDDLEDAKSLIGTENGRSRKPVGENWED